MGRHPLGPTQTREPDKKKLMYYYVIGNEPRDKKRSSR